MQGKDIEINNDFEYEDFGDTRNRKGLIEDGYTKHNTGARDKARIQFIKKKKALQSSIDKEKNKKPEGIVPEEKSRKRLLKEIAIDEKEYENNSKKIIKKPKKKKAPKKDRVRF